MRVGIDALVNVQVVVRGADGCVKDTRFAHNLVTDSGCAHIADQLASSQDEAAMSHMAVGTDDTAPAAGNTTLGTELDRQALDSFVQGAGADDHKVVYTASWAAGEGTGALVEAGIFNDASAGTLLARVVFSVISKGASDTLEITWTLTIADDGS
jgi:hypothetical protein